MVIIGNDPICQAYETRAYPSMLYHHIETHSMLREQHFCRATSNGYGMCFYMVDRKRIELLPLTCKASVLPLSLTAHITDYLSHCTPSVKARFGAPHGIRTHKIQVLSMARIPIPSKGLFSVFS